MSHGMHAGFPNSPQMGSTPADGINTWCSPIRVRLAKGFTWAFVDAVHSSCVFSELPSYLRKKLHFGQWQEQQQYKISSLATVVSQSLQRVHRKDFSDWILSFKSFWCKSCWTGWFSYLLITQYIFFTAAGRESLHIWADSQDTGSTSSSLIFYGSWEQHCPLWELSPRAQLSSFSRGG